MKTTTYAEVLRHATELTGRAYVNGAGRVTLSSEAEAVMRGFIGQSIRSAWTAAPFPESTAIERRTFAPLYLATTAYAVGDVV